MPAMRTYVVWSLDVWGNEEDGFEVNDRCKVGSIELPTYATDADIEASLIDAGFLRRGFALDVDGDDTIITIDLAGSGMPLFMLERERLPSSDTRGGIPQ